MFVIISKVRNFFSAIMNGVGAKKMHGLPALSNRPTITNEGAACGGVVVRFHGVSNLLKMVSGTLRYG
jgi:hypothetical protein